MASSPRRLRVLDFGTVTPLRSQTSWHALGYGRSDPDEATLSFVRPRAPYVCLGRHRSFAEVNHEALQRLGLPLLRRMAGGGPVYLDAQQLFFQVALPTSAVPARRDLALASLLAPAVSALRRLGVDAVFDERGEVSVGAAKVCGHGAAQIGDHVVVVGNLIRGFDHERASQVLATASPTTSAEVQRLMERYVAATPVDPTAWRTTMVEEYAALLGATPVTGRLRVDEQRALTRLDSVFASPGWVRHVDRPAGEVRTIKVRAGVWVHEWAHDGGATVLSVTNGRVDSVLVDGLPARDLRPLVGAPLDEVRRVLTDHTTHPLATALAAVPAGRVSA